MLYSEVTFHFYEMMEILSFLELLTSVIRSDSVLQCRVI
jgi:hypothetical protein